MEVAVGQGRERGARCEDVHQYVLAPMPPLLALVHSRKGPGVAVGWKEGWWRLAEVGELFETKAPTGNHRLELSTCGKS